MQQRLEAACRQIAQLQTQLQQQTGRDPLTGMLELTPFMNSLGQELGRAGRYGRPVSVVRIDIDNFEAVNIQYGAQRATRCWLQPRERLRVRRARRTSAAASGATSSHFCFPRRTPPERRYVPSESWVCSNDCRPRELRGSEHRPASRRSNVDRAANGCSPPPVPPCVKHGRTAAVEWLCQARPGRLSTSAVTPRLR